MLLAVFLYLLDSLLCNLIAPTSGLAFFLPIRRTVAALSFSSGRAYPSLNFLPRLSLRLTPTLITLKSTSFLTTLHCLHFLMFMLLLIAHLRWIAEPTPLLHPFFPLPETSSFWVTSTAISLSGTQKVLLTSVVRKYSIESSLPQRL